jgi:hypothetical protein
MSVAHSTKQVLLNEILMLFSIAVYAAHNRCTLFSYSEFCVNFFVDKSSRTLKGGLQMVSLDTVNTI